MIHLTKNWVINDNWLPVFFAALALAVFGIALIFIID